MFIKMEGEAIRPLSRIESSSTLQQLDVLSAARQLSPAEAVLRRRLKILHSKNPQPRLTSKELLHPTLIPLPQLPSELPPNPQVISALYGIQSTHYDNSFASRLLGSTVPSRDQPVLILRDWESRAPWMDLMDDIQEHYSLKQ